MKNCRRKIIKALIGLLGNYFIHLSNAFIFTVSAFNNTNKFSIRL
jgi:hypothetical protein